MSISFVRDVYARPGGVRERGGASFSRSSARVQPVTSPVASDTPRTFTYRPLHRGLHPTVTACLCACHGDPRDECDVVSCRD